MIISHLRNLISRRDLAKYALVLILALAAGLRLLGLDKSLWLDEASTLQVIFSPSFFQAIRAYDHPPLYFTFLHLWSALGRTEALLRLPSVIFGIAAVVVMMADLKHHNAHAAWVVGLIAAVSPVLLRFSQEIRHYALLILLTALAFYFANRLVRDPGSKLGQLGLVISLAAAVCTHLAAAFLIPAVGVYLVSFSSTRCWQTLILLAAPAIVFVLVYFFFIPPTVRLRTAAEWGEEQLSFALLLFIGVYLAGAYSFLAPLPAIYPQTDLLTLHPLSLIPFLAMLMVITGLLLGKWRKGLPYLLAALTYWGGLALYSTFSAVILSERTALPGLVPFMAFAGIQLTEPRQPVNKWANSIAVGVLCLAALLNWITFSAWQPQEDWRGISQAVTRQWQPGDKLILYPNYCAPALEYYAPLISPEDMLLVSILKHHLKDAADLSPLDQVNPPNSIFLIYRPDTQAQKTPAVYEQLQTHLASRFGPPQTVTFGWLTLHKYSPDSR